MQFPIILVSPARAENIGAAARAMKTMGFSELRIVASEAYLQPPTRWVAHGAGDIIDNIKIYPTLTDAIQDMDFVIATTARSRAKFHYYATPEQLLPLLREKQQWMSRVALVFGREDSGLTNEELALADMLTGVPMVVDYPSLNLGQAVMVYCYQLASLMQTSLNPIQQDQGKQLDALRQRVSALLEKLNVLDDNKMSDWLTQRLGFLGQRDTAMLHRLLHDIEKNIAE